MIQRLCGLDLCTGVDVALADGLKKDVKEDKK